MVANLTINGAVYSLAYDSHTAEVFVSVNFNQLIGISDTNDAVVQNLTITGGVGASVFDPGKNEIFMAAVNYSGNGDAVEVLSDSPINSATTTSSSVPSTSTTTKSSSSSLSTGYLGLVAVNAALLMAMGYYAKKRGPKVVGAG